jgi:hypothetical protein
MIGELPLGAALPLPLVDAHVSAIQVIHKMGLQDIKDRTALALCAELDARVNEIVAAAGK